MSYPVFKRRREAGMAITEVMAELKIGNLQAVAFEARRVSEPEARSPKDVLVESLPEQRDG